MTEIDERFREALDRMTGPVPPADWQAVLAQAAPRPQRRRAVLALLAALAAAVLWVATPLGAALTSGIGGFSSWLSGEPGTPAPRSAQQAFEHANSLSWLGFPAGTKLRQLTTVHTAGKTIDLLGFRAGGTLCLRIHVSDLSRSGTQACAPLAALRQAGSPVRVVLVDYGFGKGTKQAWYGLDHLRAPQVQVTAGIAADGVRSVTLHDQSGSHTVPVRANAFLYVAATPDVGQRVDRISARTAARTAAVPFAPALFGFAGGAVPAGKPSGPTTIQRHVHGGTIGWLVNHRAVGQPLTVLKARFRDQIERHAVFGRVVAPDPGLPYRVAITLNTSPRGTRPIGVCTWQIGASGQGGGGCQRRASMFASGPVTSGIGSGDGSGEYNTVAGLASDDVARIAAFLSNGQTQPVALKDNAYFAELARVGFPVRLVAYDANGQIIGLQTIRGFDGFGAGPVQGRPTLIKHVATASGGYVELYIGPSTAGGTCTYVKWRESSRAGGVAEGCGQPGTPAHGSGLSLQSMGNPAFFVTGPAPAGTARFVLHFADGTTTTTRPTRGYLVYAIPAGHVETGHQLTRAAAVGSGGATIASESFPVRPTRAG